MYELDQRVLRVQGFSVWIVDPQVYVNELGEPLELVREVLRRRVVHSTARIQGPERWRPRC